jgi:hypothetical protein
MNNNTPHKLPQKKKKIDFKLAWLPRLYYQTISAHDRQFLMDFTGELILALPR